MTKKFLLPIAFSVILMISGCGDKGADYADTKSQYPQLEEVFSISELHGGDAKFYGDSIITSVGGKLRMYDLSGNLLNTYDIDTNWISCLSDENIIIYGNQNSQVGIVRMSQDREVLSDYIIYESGENNASLCIDPTIIKIDGYYYVTFTEVFGTVNNAVPDAENGEYVIRMYRSGDLQNWTKVNDVLDEKHNLEDADIFYANDQFYVCCERETVDKGDSAIILISSKDDSGKEWNEPVCLLQADCDHEPAAVTDITEHGFRLYYSCDRENPGESYDGSKIYYADFDLKGKCLDCDKPVISQMKEGILLYDVEKYEGEEYFLYAGNYFTTNDMVVERMR